MPSQNMAGAGQMLPRTTTRKASNPGMILFMMWFQESTACTDVPFMTRKTVRTSPHSKSVFMRKFQVIGLRGPPLTTSYAANIWIPTSGLTSANSKSRSAKRRSSLLMLACFVMNVKPMDYTATERTPIAASSKAVTGPRPIMDFPGNGTLETT